MENPEQAKNYHNVTAKGHGNVALTLRHADYIREKEECNVKNEIKLEMQENCRVEHDELMDCQVRTGVFFALWRCRKPQHDVWECERKYRDKQYRKKREIEILEARQQQGIGALAIYNRDVADIFNPNTEKTEQPKGEIEIDGVKVKIDATQAFRVRTAEVDIYRKEHSVQFERAISKQFEHYGMTPKRPTIKKHESATLEEIYS